MTYHLQAPVEEQRDHILGPDDAPITLVEYGSYVCPYCHAANDRIAEIRNEFGDRLRYVFRHRPITGLERARKAAEIVERAQTPEQFWRIHVLLMERGDALTDAELNAIARDENLHEVSPEVSERARRRVDEDIASARESGAYVSPTFFINGRRYEGAWDSISFKDALVGSLGHRVQVAALEFARWAPSAGLLLLLATVLALVLSNSPLAERFAALWEMDWGIMIHGTALQMPLREWINDGLLTIFFLVVGLEIKRELTVGHLADRRAAALPVAAAIGGLAVPALLYRLVSPLDRPLGRRGWGVPSVDRHGVCDRAHRDDGAARADRVAHLSHRRSDCR